MKKAVFSLIALLLLLLCAYAPAEEETYTYEDFTYKLREDGGAVLVSYKGPEGDVVIPNTLDGHPVTDVEGNPFFNYWNYEIYWGYEILDCTVSVARDHPCLATIDGVLFCKTDRRLVYYSPSAEGAYEIPQGIESIGDRAFYNCSSLTSVSIPDSVTSIGEAAFLGCSNLTALSIPDSVTSIGSGAFQDCSSLTSVSIPDSVTSIGEAAFLGCSNLTAVSIPDSVTSIGYEAFLGCSSLTAVSIPDSVTLIGDGAFANCQALKEITVSEGNAPYVSADGILYTKALDKIICYPAGRKETQFTVPDSVTSIGSAAFLGCSSLSALSIPDSVTSIGSWAFQDCESLTEIVLPDSVTELGEYAFSMCPGLKSVTLPGNVRVIGEGLFWRDTALTEIRIPDGVAEIGQFAFDECSGLTAVSIPDSVTSIGDWAFSGCSSLTVVSIPDSVTSIGICAFSGCSGLTAVSIPDSVTSIGDFAFSGCPNLTLTVPHGSHAEQYCRKNNLPYTVDPAFSYNILDDGTAEITGYHGGETRVVIPETISGHTVTGLVTGTFDGCAQITAIEIPDTVISLERSRYVPKDPSEIRDAGELEIVPDTFTSGPFRGCSSALTVTCGRGSHTLRWCKENGVAWALREEDYTESPSDWLD